MVSQDILYGIHPVLEAIRARRRPVSAVIFISGKLPERLTQIWELAGAAGIPVKTASGDRLQALAKNDRHQGVIAEAGVFRPTPAEGLADIAVSGSASPFFLVADGIMDPMNLGALIRTALGVGVRC